MRGLLAGPYHCRVSKAIDDTAPFSMRARRLMADARESLWFRPVLGACLATVTVLTVGLLNGVVADTSGIPDIDVSTLDSLLTVIASSMLAVSTFSLSIMVSAFASTSSSATARATDLVMRDDTTRTAIASFVSAFIFAIIAKVALGVGYYDVASRFVMFIATALVLAYLVVILIRWVQTLSTLGRLANTFERTESATTATVRAHRHDPLFGALPAPEEPPPGVRVVAGEVGYVADIDVSGLDRVATSRDVRIHVRVRPGALVAPSTVLAVIEGATDGVGAARSAFTVASERRFTQDPRHGLTVLSEIGQRALSPAVNDPGTAVRAINIATRILVDPVEDRTPLVQRPRLTMVPLDPAELVQAAYAPMSRDGAGTVEVAVVLQIALGAVAGHRPGALADAARRQAETALDYALRELPLEGERAQVQTAFDDWHTGAVDAGMLGPLRP